MPSSNPQYISVVVEIIRLINPLKMLDVGSGFGKYGFLAREYLELWDGREKYDKRHWQRKIDGIEVFRDYITPVHDFIYDNLYIGDVLDILPGLRKYNLILLADIIEHFTMEDGYLLIEQCKKKADNILIVTPKNMSPQKDAFKNPYEEHRYQWNENDFFKTLGSCHIFPKLADYVVLWGEVLRKFNL